MRQIRFRRRLRPRPAGGSDSAPQTYSCIAFNGFVLLREGGEGMGGRRGNGGLAPFLKSYKFSTMHRSPCSVFITGENKQGNSLYSPRAFGRATVPASVISRLASII